MSALRTPTFALEVESGWHPVEDDGKAVVLQNGEHEDERLLVYVLPPGLPLDELSVEVMRSDWSKGGGLPPLPQQERLSGREMWTCTYDRTRHRVTTAAVHMKKATLAAVCTARLERFPAVWPAARRMLASLVEPDASPGKPTGRLSPGLGGLTETWLQKLMDMVKTELKQRSMDASFEGDRVVVGDASVPIESLARQCRAAHGYEYGGLVRRFVEANLASLSGAPAPVDDVRDRLVLRLYPPGAERSREEVSRTDLEGVLTCLALEQDGDYEAVSPARVEEWGRPLDELFAGARENVGRRRVEMRRQPLGEDGEMAVLSQPVIGAAYALVLDQYPACLGRRGAFVGVPVRDTTLALPLDDERSMALLLNGFFQAVRDMFARDAYGVSATVFYFDRTGFEPVGLAEADGIVSLTAGPRLAAQLRAMKRPPMVEVEARDTTGQPIWGAAEASCAVVVDTDFLRAAESAVTDRPETNAEILRVLVKRTFGVDLAYSLKGIEALDGVLEGHFDRAALPAPMLDLVASYFGTVLVVALGGEWTRQSRSALGWGLAFGPPKMGLVRKPDGPVIDIRLRTRQSLQGGERLASAYWSLQYDIAQMRRG